MKPRLVHRVAACAWSFAVGAAVLHLTGCETLKRAGELGAVVGVATGTITEEQGQSLIRTAGAVGTALEKLTPQNEYYIGRAVMATVLQSYRPYDAATINDYLNDLGQALALASDRPETYGGYHFMALDSEEINAFAAPGGLIVVTRGLLRCCRTEDAVAAVLAHEIGHVQHQHGLKAIQKSRVTGAWTTALVEAGKSLGGQELSEATKAFEGSIGDVTQTLVNKGYGRAAEREADAAAVRILQRTGYDPTALVDMLGQMQQRWKPGGLGFMKTHPSPQDRIADVRKLVPAGAVNTAPLRQRRFAAVLGGI